MADMVSRFILPPMCFLARNHFIINREAMEVPCLLARPGNL